MLNLCEPLDIHARTRPTHTALVSENESLDYTTLATRVQQYAAMLAEHGVSKGDLVGVALRDTPEHVILLFALMRLGAVIVPMDWRWTVAEQRRLIQHFDVGTVLVDDDNTCLLLASTEMKKGELAVHCIDEAWQAQASAMRDIPDIVLDTGLPMILSLSSGTTGRPSGPLATHAHFLARTQNQLTTLTFNQHDRYMLATPLYFGGGRAFVLTHLVIGATVVMNPPPFNAYELAQAVARHKVNSLFLVPTLIRRLLKEPDDVLEGMHRLRVLISSGAPLHASERKAVQERITAGFFEYYASTEGGGITVLNPQDQSRYPDSVGRAAFEVDIQVVDDEHRPVTGGVVGQVRYRGPGVASSFYKDADASARSFVDGWFYPGDLGRINDEGYLFLLGRSKDMIIRGGVNIYPVEIERVIGGYPGIDEVAVVPAPSAEFGEEVVAFIVEQPDLVENELLEHCRKQLASYKIPSQFIAVTSLPKNSAGKVLKADLVRKMSNSEP